MDSSVYWIWLVQCFGAGNSRIWEVLSRFGGDPETTYNEIKAKKADFLTEWERKSAETTHLKQSEEMISYCELKDIDIVCFDDERYPNRLKGIFNPPAVLFCMGDISFIENEISIAVVGTRHPSPYSIKFAQKICSELSKVGVVIVSGFALGIDSMAHQAALKNHTPTVAVLGCGIDVPYPKENSQVKKVIAKNGAVISEFFPGTPPSGKNFPVRNRIISGLCLGTLVIEAGLKSGALITAECALQQGRDVFCVPPADLFDERYSGVIKLIRDGAIPTFSHIDILYEYYQNFSHKLNAANVYESYAVSHEIKNADEIKSHNEYNNSKANNIIEEKDTAKYDTSELDEQQAEIVKLLEKNGSLLADELSAMLEADVSEILSQLTELELLGIVNAQAGKRYSL